MRNTHAINNLKGHTCSNQIHIIFVNRRFQYQWVLLYLIMKYIIIGQTRVFRSKMLDCYLFIEINQVFNCKTLSLF